ADRFTAPGLGKETCSYNAPYTNFFQGFFIAPHVVMQSMKGSLLFSKVYEQAGYKVNPSSRTMRSDIVQAIEFKTERELVEFCKGIQMAAPVDSFVTPAPWDMPGYSNKVIMASGSFVQGSSMEFSADGPIREPYIAYVQGGLTYEHIRMGVMYSLEALRKLKEMRNV
ncbi:MAG: methionine gamma-lyase family protein, partial [Clostridia bacterium]|nr:methionine gamma-lyase family protein [Clostridia bacterium]